MEVENNKKTKKKKRQKRTTTIGKQKTNKSINQKITKNDNND